MRPLTLQLFNRKKWWDAAELHFDKAQMTSSVTLYYFSQYISDVLTYNAIDSWACTVNAPVTILPAEYPTWPAVLDDLLPVGKSRDWWLNYLNMARATEFEQNYALLTNACMSPVGNIRIKEAASLVRGANAQRFSTDDVARLQHDFLDYANEHGAAVGGATGAGGVAPKLLLMVDNDEVFIDADFAGKTLSATPYLTKFARNTRSSRDNNILRAEGVFYQVLNDVLGDSSIETIDVSRMKILEVDSQVSLWLPRFDVRFEDSIACRIGVESIYSIINAGPGSYQNHFSVMEKVWEKIRHSTKMTSEEFAKQYLARDLLNLVFGNSDNHGRNISFLKFEGDIRYAPIYDFAPMKADPEMVTRLFKWGEEYERGGIVYFDKLIQSLESFGDPDELMAFLRQLAEKLIKVPALLEKYGCPEEIIEFPAIGFNRIEKKLADFGIRHA
ncbi:type II toxin-antitoxin system HipA family toxin [Idiomarina seosinensis]|uniref:HipA-like protein n=1 Tax=Idiomarina seosinensis TaxID=281739 RepID=A0A432ZI71_9GAMM|nr:HipA domain-containing protein [Idiomarina seosinensis]RUO76972.1 HipA-like protein [Idiomarina seosinensis]